MVSVFSITISYRNFRSNQNIVLKENHILSNETQCTIITICSRPNSYKILVLIGIINIIYGFKKIFLYK